MATTSTTVVPEVTASGKVRGRLLVVLALGLLTAMAVSAMSGSFVISAGDVLASVLGKLGISVGGPPDLGDAVLWGIRIPRIVLGAVAGAGLAVAGAVFQGVFRNGLADPQLLGIGPGAALFAATAAALGGGWAALAAGTVGGILTALSVGRLGRRTAEADPTRLVLIGVAVGATLIAWVGFVVFGADSTRVPPVEFWLLGSLSGSTWRVTAVTGAVVLAGTVVLAVRSSTIDLLTLGRREARHLGVDVGLAMSITLLIVGAMVGVVVGAVGVVAFVGLVGPHVVRPAAGVQQRGLLPAAALAGAIFVVVADLAARTLLAPIELPVGLLTAVVGGPYLLWLIVRRGGLRP